MNREQASGSHHRRRYWFRWGVLALILLLLAGWALWQPGDLERALEWGDRLTHDPRVILGIILAQALMLTLALPGSLMLWVVAPFHEPLVAVVILLAGSLLGALGGYFVAARLGAGGWASRHRAFRILARRSDGVTQVALRMLPGFPHSVINYGAGALRLPVPAFMAAAAVGLTIKWAIYATAVHEVVEAETAEEALGLGVMLPLAILAGFVLLGAWARHWFLNRNSNNRHDS